MEKDFPCCILACRPRETDDGMDFELVVQSCHERTGRESAFLTQWSFKKEFHVVKASALVTLCFVLGGNDLSNEGNVRMSLL